MYEPTTVKIDRVCGEGNYRSYTIYFVGRLIRIVEAGHISGSYLESRANEVGATPERGNGIE